MPRTFAYARVSSAGQTVENQIREIEMAGFAVDRKRVVAETVSGSVVAAQRAGFRKLMDRLEDEDVLIVTKLDRLGRDAVDVRQTVERLMTAGVRVHCLALGGADLTSAPGKMVMQIINAMSEFELDLLKERTTTALNRLKAQGVALGRPSALSKADVEAVIAGLASGQSVSELARQFKVSRQTIMRRRDRKPIRAAA